MIISNGNPQIKDLIQLQKKSKFRKETKCFVVEGRKMIEEAEENLSKVYVSKTYYEAEKETDFIINLYKNRFFEIVSDKVFKEICDTITPQGILAVVKIPEYSLEEVLGVKSGTLLLLEDLRDPGNLGTIMRTAEGAGIRGIILSKDSVDLFNPKVVRSTMGSIFRVPFLYTNDFNETLDDTRKAGFTLYAAHLNGSRYYDEESYNKKSGIIIGNEAKGISEKAAEKADRLIKIPMEGKVESLNAAMAAGIIMYEVYRQNAYSAKL